MHLLPVFDRNRTAVLEIIPSRSDISSHEDIKISQHNSNNNQNCLSSMASNKLLIQASQNIQNLQITLTRQTTANSKKKSKLFRNSILKKKMMKPQNQQQKAAYHRFKTTISSQYDATYNNKYGQMSVQSAKQSSRNYMSRRIKTQNSHRKQVVNSNNNRVYNSVTVFEQLQRQPMWGQYRWELSLREWNNNKNSNGNSNVRFKTRHNIKNDPSNKYNNINYSTTRSSIETKDLPHNHKHSQFYLMGAFAGIKGHKAPLGETTDHFKKQFSKQKLCYKKMR